VTIPGCQVTPTPPTAKPPVTKVHETDPANLLKRAARAAPAEAARLRLASARAYAAEGAIADARSALDLVDPTQLDASNKFEVYQLHAQLALQIADIAAARRALVLAIPTNSAQRNSHALTTADVAEAESRFEDAATALMQYTFGSATDEPSEQALVDRIWADINRTPADRVAVLASAGQNPTATAWWELAAALQRSFDLDAERVAIASWRQHHRDHPANTWPPTVLNQIESGISGPTRIALLLPVSGPLGNAGRAVRDGFLAALYHGGADATVKIYDAFNVSIAGLYEQASFDGAQLIVGPLDKATVAEMNALASRAVPVLALNYLPAGVSPTTGLVQFGLAIEDEARAIARRMIQDGFYRVAILESDVDWANRADQSFREQFEALGGTIVTIEVIEDARAITDIVGNALLVDASTARMEALARTVGTMPAFIPRRRSDLDAVVALVDPSQARALNPAMAFHFAADVPIYATSQAAGVATRAELAELNGFRLTELPWRVYPSTVRDEVYAAFANAGSNLSPLYALGVDAYRLADRVDLLASNSTGALLGETGQLQVQSSGVVVRFPAWAIVSRGALVALPTVAP
jgi:uncharacterized protein